jgi:hypothetical protein
MNIRIKRNIKLLLSVLLLCCLTNNVRGQPGSPTDGFLLYLNTSFTGFPDSSYSHNAHVKYINDVLTIIFVDSSKSIESDSSLIAHCRKMIYKVDSNNTGMIILRITGSWDWTRCCADTCAKKDTSNVIKYSGKLVFVYNGMKKEFIFKNIPDGFSFYLGEVNFGKPQETISLPTNINWKNKKESKIVFDLNKYRY